MTPSGTTIDPPDGQTALDPQPRLAPSFSPILVVAMVVFLAWAGFMGWMAASYANRPRINEAQLHQAQLVILGTVEGNGTSGREGGAVVPSYQITVKEVFKNSIDLDVPKAVFVIGEEGRECDFQKDYIFAVSEAEHGEFRLVPAPFGGKKKDVPLNIDLRGYVVTPDVDGFGTKIIYPDEPAVRAQIEAFLKADAPPVAP